MLKLRINPIVVKDLKEIREYIAEKKLLMKLQEAGRQSKMAKAGLAWTN